MRQQDVNIALDSGADAVGFVVASPSSPRNLSLEKARKLMRAVPVFTAKVTVTSSDDSMDSVRLCRALRPETVQLHHHNPELIRRLRKMEPEVKLILATALRDRIIIGRGQTQLDTRTLFWRTHPARVEWAELAECMTGV